MKIAAHFPKPNRSGSTRLSAFTGAFLACVLVAGATFAADGAGGSLTYVYDDEYSKEKYGPELVLEFRDGVVTGHEVSAGMERVVVVLFAQELSKEAFLTALEEKDGVPLFAAMDVELERYAMIDVCRTEEGSEVELCGVHFYGPAISSSTSGFGGTFRSFVKELEWTDGRLSAKLASSPGHGQQFETLDLAFDLPLP